MKTIKRRSWLWTWATQFVVGGVGLALITFVCFRAGVELPTVGFAYVILIALVSLLGSFGASLLLSIVGVAALNYFFTAPLFDLRIEFPQDILAVAAFGTTSIVITALTATVRRMAEDAKAAHQALVNTIPAMIWTALPDGSRDFHNRRWVEFMGLAKGEAAGDDWTAGFHPDDRATVAENWRASLASGAGFDVE